MHSSIFKLLLILIGFILLISLGSRAFADEKLSGDSFSFVVLGHPRGEALGELSMYYEDIIAKIAELKPDFLIITGDMIWGYTGKFTDPNVIRAEWEKFDAGFNRLGIPIYRLPGNHDVHNSITKDIYFERYHKIPFAFTFKKSRLIMLDTIAIDQIKEGDRTTWKGEIKPAGERLRFIQNEVKQQQEYNHIFIFMHHPHPWSETSGSWWKDVHPLLMNGKTRAIFAGSPWYFKYAHLERDGIHYILSSCLNDPDLSEMRRDPNPNKFAIHKQLNNLQYVVVKGDKYTILPIVIGALTSKSLNWEFWDQLEKRSSDWTSHSDWTNHFAFLFHAKFYKFRNLILIEAIWGVFCLFLGVFIAVVWMRSHRK
jgi:hypothetical protein